MTGDPDPPGDARRPLPVPSRTEGFLLAALLLATAVVVGVSAWQAGSSAPTASGPAGYTPARVPAWTTDWPTTPPPAPPAAPVLAFYGDWHVSGTERGGRGPAGWPALVAARLGAVGTEPHAVPDAGYVAASAVTGETLPALAEGLPEPAADVTVVLGGRNDYRAGPAEITEAAVRTLVAIRGAAPGTRLLVVGPIWPGATVPPELFPVRDALRQAATDVGATFLDPLVERWFVGVPGLVAEDGISPTDQGHVHLADRIEPAVRDLLAG